LITGILGGTRGAARDIVVVNAAAALWTAGKSDSARTCAEMAAAAIDRGEAARLLAQLVELSNKS
jgi:anthranilate phosphoribosyltransferase